MEGKDEKKQPIFGELQPLFDDIEARFHALGRDNSFEQLAVLTAFYEWRNKQIGNALAKVFQAAFFGIPKRSPKQGNDESKKQDNRVPEIQKLVGQRLNQTLFVLFDHFYTGESVGGYTVKRIIEAEHQKLALDIMKILSEHLDPTVSGSVADTH